MNVDPFAHWYGSQLAAEGARDFEAEKWDFFTISHNANASEDVRENPISMEQIDEWVDERPSLGSPGIDVLFARHKDCAAQDFQYQCVPLRAVQLRSVFERLNLPVQYFYLRGVASAHCNASTCQTYTDSRGNIERISFLIRIGYASAKNCGESTVWTLALTWDARTSRTTGFIEGFSHSTLSEFKFYISSCLKTLGHPLTLPMIILHMTTVQLHDRLSIPCEEEFYREEYRTGLSNAPYPLEKSRTAIWSWEFQNFQDVAVRANKCFTTMVFLQRRFRYAKDLARSLVSLMDELKDGHYENVGIPEMLAEMDQWRRQTLKNQIKLLADYEHQTECVQKRIGNLNTVLYTVLSQIDSKSQANLARTNLRIAQAVRSDSIPIRTIAYVTLLLLPGALIASIFGSNFFSFDPVTSDIRVAKTFWIYWAITVPITLLVIGIWNVWNFNEVKNTVDMDKDPPFLNPKPYWGGVEKKSYRLEGMWT